MGFRSMAIKSAIILGALAILSISSVCWHESSLDGNVSSGAGMFFARPAFAQVDELAFLEQEAGISAYINVGRIIDLGKAKSTFSTVESETDEYLIGSVPLPDYPETEDVHAYVRRSGLIVAYYLRAEPAGKIVDWGNYNEEEKMQSTKLETGIANICAAASIPMKDVKYYDFRHPDANELMIAAKSLWEHGEEEFRIKLPSALIFYERSYSHCDKGDGRSEMYIDEETISNTPGYETNCGILSPTQLSLDVFHNVKVKSLHYWGMYPPHNYYGYPAFGAIVLVLSKDDTEATDVIPSRVMVEYSDTILTLNLEKPGTSPSLPPSTEEDELAFRLSLDMGLNMVSLPLNPGSNFTARAFAEKLGASTVISYDVQQDEFIPFVPEVFSGDGFLIEGGQGYIVNALEEKDVIFRGSGWSNMVSQAPSVDKPVWAFVVVGTVFDYDGIPLEDPTIHIKLGRAGSRVMVTSPIGQSEPGGFAAPLVDMNRKQVVSTDSSLEISLLDMAGDLILDPIIYSIGVEEIRKGYAKLSIRLSDSIPEKSALLQNYPNPFNPETWLPYQISEASDVVVRIFNSQGQLVRRLQLGQREAGLYLSRERSAYWNGRNEAGEEVSSGIYFYSIAAGSFAATKKLVVAR